MTPVTAPSPKRMAIVGTHLPRKCGIATFTHDLTDAIAQQLCGDEEIFVVALDDILDGYPYPPRVRCRIQADQLSDYAGIAEYINALCADVVLVQHEYGIFGGPAGKYILDFMRHVEAPIVTTLHTVLSAPSVDERRVMAQLRELSDRLVVMCDMAENILQTEYQVPASRIVRIPHGIHDFPRGSDVDLKDGFRANGKLIILTFGLLSPAKGIEYMIDAMPKIMHCFPDALYVVLGATHPNLKREEGEAYRIGLQHRVHALGLSDNVRFIDEFVELGELCRYLQAADIYVTPYVSEAQTSSGTLAFALGAGKAIVSTPYRYAQELLADGRGLLVPFKNSMVLAEAITALLEDDSERQRMSEKAYAFGRSMTWNAVARQYLRLAETVALERLARAPAMDVSQPVFVPAERMQSRLYRSQAGTLAVSPTSKTLEATST